MALTQISTAGVKDDAVTAGKIPANAVGSSELADNAVDTAAIAADAVTGAKIADDAVGAEHIEQLDNNLQFADSCHAKFGTDNDLAVYHDGNNANIVNTTGDLYIEDSSGNIYIRAKASENSIICHDDGAVELYHDNTKRFETHSEGTYHYGHSTFIIGDEGESAQLFLHADDGDDNADKWKIVSAAGGSFYLQNYTSGSWESNLIAYGNGGVELYHDNSKRLETTSVGVKLLGSGTDAIEMTGDVWFNNNEHAGADIYFNSGDKHLIFEDNVTAKFGGGADLKIWHDGSDSYIRDSGTGGLIINSNAFYLNNAGQTENMIRAFEDGAVELYYDNVKKLNTNPGGIKVLGNVACDGDNQKLILGAGDDLQLYHDGSTNIIDGLYHPIELRHQSEVHIKCVDDGAVELYHNNVKKFATGGSGIYHNNNGTLNQNAIHFETGTGGSDYSTKFGVTNFPDHADYGDQNDGYWALIESKGGTIVVLNTDGAYDTSRSNHDHFSIYQKAGTESSNAGRRLFSVDNVGGVQFGQAGLKIDREWDNQSSLSLQRDCNDGNDNTDGSAYLRVHGTGRTHASWVGGNDGSDFSANLLIDGTTYGTSDRRAKTDIIDCPYGLDVVNKLQPRKFQLVNSQLTPQGDDNINLGFIAQEIKEHIPECVNYLGDKANTPNEKGWARAYALDMGEVVPVLTKAIQEVSAQIKTLQTKVAALEAA